MRAVLALSLLIAPLPAAPAAAQRELTPYSWETPEQTEQRFRRLREADETLRDYYGRVRPSDLAECRARGNTTFGRIEGKIAVMHDCLEARRLRRQGR